MGSTRRSTRLRRGEPRGRRSGGNTRTGFLSSLRSLQRPGLAIWTKRSTWFPQISQLDSSTSSSENQPETRRRALLLREQRDPTHLRHHGLLVPGAPRRGLFPVHCILRRVCVRRGVEKLFICLRQLSAKLDPFEAKRFRARL